MRTMVDLSKRQGPLRITDGTSTAIDCKKEDHRRRTLRLLVGCVAPCWGFRPANRSATDNWHVGKAINGTFYGYRRGHVHLCIQDDRSRGRRPLLLLEFSIPTCHLAREMQHGLLRIALECGKGPAGAGPDSLFDVHKWSVCFNGRRLGFAVRREMDGADAAVFKLMKSISVGAGVLPIQGAPEEGELMYLRARFERVAGSRNSETFHMINPNGSSGQELSVFFLRS